MYKYVNGKKSYNRDEIIAFLLRMYGAACSESGASRFSKMPVIALSLYITTNHIIIYNKLYKELYNELYKLYVTIRSIENAALNRYRE